MRFREITVAAACAALGAPALAADTLPPMHFEPTTTNPVTFAVPSADIVITGGGEGSGSTSFQFIVGGAADLPAGGLHADSSVVPNHTSVGVGMPPGIGYLIGLAPGGTTWRDLVRAASLR